MRKVLIFWGLMFTFFLSLSAQGQKMAVTNQPIATPTYVNILWDTNWDNDNPTMKIATIDAITEAVVRSSYFKGLSEYGVTSVSFMGSFLPDSHCAAKAPNSVGFYDPFNSSIAGFVQCEHDNGPALLRQSNVIYNVILPASSLESDFWTNHFCTGSGSPSAWHYHGLENTLGWPFGNGPFSGPPIYTIVLANPACLSGSDLLFSMTHEMVEAATDPFPVDISIVPPHANINVETEIADLCEDTAVMIFTDASGNSPMATPISLATYWSNARQKCVSFSDTTQPTVNNVTVTNWGSQTAFGITGGGFGTIPMPIGFPAPGLPYIEVKSTTRNWEAGNPINGDGIPLVLHSWFNTEVLNIGFGSGGTINNVPGSALTVWLCNPESLRCSSHAATTAVGPYNPRLQVQNVVTGEFNLKDTITISSGSQQLLQDNVDGRCAPCTFSTVQTLTPGAYSLIQTVTGTEALTKVTNGCQHLVLAPGQESSCTISDTGPPLPDACQKACSGQIAGCLKIKPVNPKACAQEQAACLRTCK